MIDNYLRVTEVLDYFPEPGLLEWKLRVGTKEAKRISTLAMKLGTEVDTYIKADICGLKLPKLKSDEAKNCVKAWNKWKDDYLPMDMRVATRLFNDTLMVTGEPDFYLGNRVIDIKCASEIRPKYWLQTAMYKWLEQDFDAPRTGILRLDKNLAEYEYVTEDDRQVIFTQQNVMEGLIRAYRYFNEPMAQGEGNAKRSSNTQSSTSHQKE